MLRLTSPGRRSMLRRYQDRRARPHAASNLSPVTTRPALEIPASLREELELADALPEVVVLIEPSPEVLEAYTVEEKLAVIAVMAGTPEARAAALEAGALEVL